MKRRVGKRNSEAGQALLLVILGMGIFLLGAAGLALDGSNLYANRQMAQAAADAAAQAGILSIFDGTNSQPAATNPHRFIPTSTATTCATSDAATPCYYAQNANMNGFNASTDTVTYDIPSISVPNLSASDPVNLLRVTVSRNVGTTLMALLGPSFSTISASGIAAIVQVASPVPILVTHPTLTQSFSASGTGSVPKIQICGGPARSIQVNSNNQTSLGANGNPIVDLSHAGPLDPGDCSAGTGADFGDFGGPGAGSVPFVLQSGTGRYVQPASPIVDPLASVSPPTIPSVTGAEGGTVVPNGTNGCPAAPPKPCHFFTPGLYSGSNDISLQNDTAVFKPGIYYMQGTNFETHANGSMVMATGFTDTGAGTTGTGWTQNMLVYMTGTGTTPTIGHISVGANGAVNLIGSPNASSYKGILFFADRNAAAQQHSFDGGGGLTLVGTIYLNTLLSIMQATPSQYQTLNMGGNAGSSTHITGEIIAPVIALSGTPGIVMNLNPAATSIVRQVALVQ